MGDRYTITIVCPNCKFEDSDCWYAPTCGFIEWKCPKCDTTVDLEKYTGISKESCSNIEIIQEMCKEFKEGKE